MKEINILLVYPKFPETFWSFKHALKFTGKSASMPPLGLLTIAGMLSKQWNIKLIDLNIEKLNRKNVIWADYIFISAIDIQKNSVKKILPLIKKYNRNSIIIAGGPLFTLEGSKEYPEINHFVLNEGEITLPQFLENLKNGNLEKEYRTTEFSDIKKSPMPRWDLIKLNRYGSVGIQFSRGCPFNCNFCSVTTLFGKTPRTKLARQFINELDALYLRGYRGSIFIVDDNFTGKKEVLVESILPALIEWKKNKTDITFYTEVSIDIAARKDGKLINETLIKMMVKAGITTVFIGIETINKDSLVECNKMQNARSNPSDSVKTLLEHGIEVNAGFILGFDHDKESIFDELIKFIQNNGIVTAMVGLLQAPTGTELYKKMKEENRLLGDMTGDNSDGTTNIKTKMPINILTTGYKKIIQEIYAPEKYYERIIIFLKAFIKSETNPEPKSRIKVMLTQFIAFVRSIIKIKMDFSQFMALVRSVIYLGIIGKERKHYWKLIFWTSLNLPEFLPKAITLAIYCRHYYLWMKSIVSRTTQIA